MPELPEVENVRRTLKTLIIGKEIRKVNVLYPKIVTGDGDEFRGALEGQKITDIKRIGKYLIFILEDRAFLSHLRMEGKYRYLPHCEAGTKGCLNLEDKSALDQSALDQSALEPFPLDKHDHLMVIFSDGSRLCYNDVRKFGRLQLVDKENYSCEPPLSQLGPEPWKADAKELYQKFQKSNLPIKALLLEQKFIAGIGNIYANEICFQMGLNPHTAGSKLSKKRVEELIKVTEDILEKSIALGGTSIHSFSSVGLSGNYQQELKVHGQKQCLVCGGKIIKEKVKGRGTYYCNHCQKKRR